VRASNERISTFMDPKIIGSKVSLKQFHQAGIVMSISPGVEDVLPDILTQDQRNQVKSVTKANIERMTPLFNFPDIPAIPAPPPVVRFTLDWERLQLMSFP